VVEAVKVELVETLLMIQKVEQVEQDKQIP
jgi:hypothetical protein